MFGFNSEQNLQDVSVRVPGSFHPLAQVSGDEGGTQLHYIVTDVSGAARELCSEEGRVVWRGEQGLWGGYREAVVPQALKRWPGDAANEEISCALRYQGQLYDAESGLYYNRHRYYDPELGQYISPDPIGIAGGINLYAYVTNPLTYIDPLGLTGCSIKPGKNFKDHFIRHKGLLENHLGKNIQNGRLTRGLSF